MIVLTRAVVACGLFLLLHAPSASATGPDGIGHVHASAQHLDNNAPLGTRSTGITFASALEPRANNNDTADAHRDRPRLLLRDEDVQWLQVLGEGWAAPLTGFMREDAYARALKQQSPNGTLPIVLPLNDAGKRRVGNASEIVLVSPAGTELAVLSAPEVFAHRKDERIHTIVGKTEGNASHPYVKELRKSGEWLVGGEVRLLKRIRYHDGLDGFRLTPDELRRKFDAMGADAVVALHTRGLTHAGHAQLLVEARRQLMDRGYKNPVAWVSPVGGWTKDDAVPLDVRIRQHEAGLREGMFDQNNTVVAIWPSPTLYAGRSEISWLTQSRRSAGATFFLLDRASTDDDDKDLCDDDDDDGEKKTKKPNDHRHLLGAARDTADSGILCLPKMYYDVTDRKMKPKDKARKDDFVKIKESRIWAMAAAGAKVCDGDQIPKDWEKNPNCVPPGLMPPSAWDIVAEYSKNRVSPRWIPFSTQFSNATVDPQRPSEQNGTFGRPDYKYLFKNDKGEPISPWHHIPLRPLNNTKLFNFIVEIPQGIGHKMEVNKQEPFNKIMQDRTHNGTRGRDYLYGVPFFNYGLFPQTWEDPSVKDAEGNGGDNDPLDAIEIGAALLPMGSVNAVKVIGSLELVDQGEVDHKILVISATDPDFDRINNTDDLDIVKPGTVAALTDWLRNYKIPEGKSVNHFGQETPTSAAEAEEVVLATHVRWEKLLAGEIPNKDNFWLG